MNVGITNAISVIRARVEPFNLLFIKINAAHAWNIFQYFRNCSGNDRRWRAQPCPRPCLTRPGSSCVRLFWCHTIVSTHTQSYFVSRARLAQMRWHFRMTMRLPLHMGNNLWFGRKYNWICKLNDDYFFSVHKISLKYKIARCGTTLWSYDCSRWDCFHFYVSARMSSTCMISFCFFRGILFVFSILMYSLFKLTNILIPVYVIA